jgi:DNA-binding SARP family transcriptional activator
MTEYPPLDTCAPAVALRLLGGFELRCDDHIVDVAPAPQRVLAFLALHPRALPRTYVAGSLWPETTDAKASANLRTALWRLQACGDRLVEVTPTHVALRGTVWVDTRAVDAAAQRLRSRGEVPGSELIDLARGELLPGAWDSWVVFERERLRVEAVHVLEAIGQAALLGGDSYLAVLAGLAAVACDPLQESANVLVIDACLAAGNHAGAIQAYRRYESTLADELGISPDVAVERVVALAITRR